MEAGYTDRGRPAFLYEHTSEPGLYAVRADRQQQWRPVERSHTARLKATVLLPVPPLRFAITVIMLFTQGIFASHMVGLATPLR